MARPVKPRRVCRMPVCAEYMPSGGAETFITLSVDEFEAIRLIDAEGFSQEECANGMQIARATAQMIYDSARKKLAQALAGGMGIRIEGGSYTVCGLCRAKEARGDAQTYEKGEKHMKIAVTYENGSVFQHFGHTEQAEDGKIVSEQVVDTMGSGHGALAGFLSHYGVEVLICGGIGGGAQMALAQAGIRLFGGVSGDADSAVRALLDGSLAFNPDVKCNHHHHDHEEGHACGSHGCGKDNCAHHG